MMKDYLTTKLTYQSMEALSPIPFRVSKDMQQAMQTLAEKVTAKRHLLADVEPAAMLMFLQLAAPRDTHNCIAGRSLYVMLDSLMRLIEDAFDGDDFEKTTHQAAAAKLVNDTQALLYKVVFAWSRHLVQEVAQEYPAAEAPLMRWLAAEQDVTDGLRE